MVIMQYDKKKNYSHLKFKVCVFNWNFEGFYSFNESRGFSIRILSDSLKFNAYSIIILR